MAAEEPGNPDSDGEILERGRFRGFNRQADGVPVADDDRVPDADAVGVRVDDDVADDEGVDVPVADVERVDDRDAVGVRDDVAVG